MYGFHGRDSILLHRGPLNVSRQSLTALAQEMMFVKCCRCIIDVNMGSAIYCPSAGQVSYIAIPCPTGSVWVLPCVLLQRRSSLNHQSSRRFCGQVSPLATTAVQRPPESCFSDDAESCFSLPESWMVQEESRSFGNTFLMCYMFPFVVNKTEAQNMLTHELC